MAEIGLEVRLAGGFEGVVSEVDGDDVLVALGGGGVTRVRQGDPVTVDGRMVTFGPPAAPSDVVDTLKAWRLERARSDGVPAYVVLSDAHLDGIARAMPASLEELARCKGIGPTKLERYGDDLLALLEDVR
ncbi:MAG: HRDC domain-containing protein [Actinomycetota bacterium]